MPNFFKIPLLGTPERFRITLSGIDYWIKVTYKNVTDGGWVMDISDSTGNSLVNGIPLVTGVNLLAQYPHLGFKGRMWIQTDYDPDAVPTFTNLGSSAKLFWVTD